MIWVLGALKAGVGAAIIGLNGISFVPREAACRLIPLQKFLTREIDRRRRDQ